MDEPMSPRLSPETQRRVEMMYPPEQREEVTRYLVNECRHNIPGTHPDENEFAFERFRFAALKVSNGDIEILKKAIDLAKNDYRDLLTAAGFAWDTTKHERWLPKGIGPQQEGWWARRRKRIFGL
jgi:hypothetical protein